MDLIREVENPYRKAELPTFHTGDTVEVGYRIREGDKERIQVFTGTVIAIKGEGLRRNFIVRRIVQGSGVERTFPLHSPRVASIAVTRLGKVRRAKLYYLRDRVGKATKVKEKIVISAKKTRTRKRRKAKAAKAAKTAAE